MMRRRLASRDDPYPPDPDDYGPSTATTVPAGTMVAMEFVAVYDDGTRVTIASQPASVSAIVGDNVKFSDIELTVS